MMIFSRIQRFGKRSTLRLLTSTLVVVMSLPVALPAGQGSAGAQFLKIGGGVRGAALGGTYVARDGEIQGMYFNPAVLDGVSRIKFQLTHIDYLAGMDYDYVAFAMPLAGIVVGAQIAGLFSGDILRTTESDPEGDAGDFFVSNDYMASFSFARRMSNKFTAGGTVKYVRQNLDRVAASGVAFDVGAHYRTGLFANLRLGFSLRNFGRDLKFEGEGLQGLGGKSGSTFEEEDVKFQYESEAMPLPLSFELGAVLDFKMGPVTAMVNAEAKNSIDQLESVSAGVDLYWGKLAHLAVGHANLLAPNLGFGKYLVSNDSFYGDFDSNRDYDETVGGNMYGLTMGGGLNLEPVLGQEAWLEFAWQDHRYLDPVVRFGIQFGL